MSVVQQLHCAPRYNTLNTIDDPARGVYRCNMHADLVSAPGRACFKTALVDEILHYQQALADRLRMEQQQGGSDMLPHVVLASDSDVFNLGGDLELFCRLIRKGDRNGLLGYARQCVRGVHAFHAGLGVGAHSIALV
jgi:DSF synthase